MEANFPLKTNEFPLKINGWSRGLPSLKLTAKAPENGWLEYYFPIGEAYFQGLLLLVSGRVFPYWNGPFWGDEFVHFQARVTVKPPKTSFVRSQGVSVIEDIPPL